jgi:response regulator RpfG family c-di-GMP phosphodiesterase
MLEITLLIIDDCHDSNSLIEFVLKHDTDWKIITAINGEEGVTQARRHQPNVILLDIAMPDLDGFDVYRILKSDPTTSYIPIIFTTAMAGVESRIKRQIAEDTKIISKPFNIRLLQKQIINTCECYAKKV